MEQITMFNNKQIMLTIIINRSLYASIFASIPTVWEQHTHQ